MTSANSSDIILVRMSRQSLRSKKAIRLGPHPGRLHIKNTEASVIGIPCTSKIYVAATVSESRSPPLIKTSDYSLERIFLRYGIAGTQTELFGPSLNEMRFPDGEIEKDPRISNWEIHGSTQKEFHRTNGKSVVTASAAAASATGVHRAATSQCVFGFRDPTTSLVNHRQL